MSQLQPSLHLFGFSDIQDVTSESLKKAFKLTVLKAHPDKGGSQQEFDELLSAYVYLMETVNRLYGGRNSLHDVLSPEELKESRLDEVVNRVFEVFEREAFHSSFEENHVIPSHGSHGYHSWLQDSTNDSNVTEGEYGSATQKPPMIVESELQTEFEKQAKDGKPEPTALILHPEQMAYSSGVIMGTSILETSGCYTSEVFQKPEYTDVYAAFTKENTVCDKVSSYEESKETFEDRLAERKKEIIPYSDKELEIISQFEKMKLQEEHQHLQKVKDYFEHGTSVGALDNWPPTHYPKKEYKGFVVEL
jgi:curved DNA-binding protein CbpA